jgi:predicted Rdx family selenoprotein
LRDFLSSQAQLNDNAIEIIGKKDGGITGNFEVTCNKILIHSKKMGGQGKAENQKERQMIVDQIVEIMVIKQEEEG